MAKRKGAAVVRNAILFRAADARRAPQFHQVCELLKLPRERRRMGLIDAEENVPLLIRGTWPPRHPGPVDLRVRLRGSRWVQLIPPDCIPDAGDAASRTPALDVIVLRHDEAAKRWSLRAVVKGKPAVTFAAVGEAGGPLTDATFKSTLHTKSFLTRCGSIVDAVEKLLRSFDALPVRQLVAERVGENTLRLRADDGGPSLRAADVDGDAWVTEYVPVSETDDPASAALRKAIDRADPAAVRKAVRAGASLRFVAGEMTSPLNMAMLHRRGRPGWLACVKALVDLGASLDGNSPDDDPAIIVAAEASGVKEQATIELLDYLLSAGADIEARSRYNHGNSTPLHCAANSGMLAVVMFLVSRGADVHATVVSGVKASDLARPNHLFIGDEHAMVQQFLRAAEAGPVNVSRRMINDIARRADRWRRGASAAADLVMQDMIKATIARGRAKRKAAANRAAKPRRK